MPEIPFAIEWAITINRLTSLKDSINDESLYSTRVSNTPHFVYYLSITLNESETDECGEIWILLHLEEFNNVKKVHVRWNVSIDSANCSFPCTSVYENSIGHAYFICDAKDFFNPEKKFIVDGKCTVKVNGVFKFKNEKSATTEMGEKQKWNGGELGDELWAKNDSKNFTIIIDKKEIKVHKLILDTRSNVFGAMLRTKMIESIENKVSISGFSFAVVETAIKLIYDCNFVTSLSFDDTMLLLHFFDVYDLPFLKEKVEHHLICQISVSNVCRLTNCSISTNSEKLKSKCIKFLTTSFFVTKTPLADIEDLDKNIAFKILQSSLYKHVETANSIF